MLVEFNGKRYRLKGLALGIYCAGVMALMLITGALVMYAPFILYWFSK